MQKGKIDYIALQCNSLKAKKKRTNTVYNGICALRSRSAETSSACVAPLRSLPSALPIGHSKLCKHLLRLYSRLSCRVSINNS